MATRTIVTSQPDVACDVCERRLLRGEQADIFLAAGRRRTVCELCAPRAAHEGWMRERDSQSVSLPPMRPRRGKSFFDRLPVPFRVRQVGRASGAPVGPAGDEDAAGRAAPSYDFLDGYDAGDPPRGRPRATPAGIPSLLPEDAGGHGEGGESAHESSARPASYAERAVEILRRIALHRGGDAAADRRFERLAVGE